MNSDRGGADGNIFSMDTDGTGYTPLFNFNSANGRLPIASLTLSRGILYGMTELGGNYNYGVIFKYNLNISTSVKAINTNEKGLSVYPNPGKGVFTVQSSVVGARPDESFGRESP